MTARSPRLLTKADRDRQRRIVREFTMIWPLFFAQLALIGTIAAGLCLQNGLYLTLAMPLGLVAFAAIRARKWYRTDPHRLSLTAIENHIEFLRVSSLLIAALAALCFTSLMAGVPQDVMMIVTVLLVVMGMISALCFYSQQSHACRNVGVLFAPPVFFLVGTAESSNIALAGVLSLVGLLICLMVVTINRLVTSHFTRSMVARAQVEAERRALEHLLSVAQPNFAEMTLQGLITLASDGFVKLTGLPRRMLVGRHLERLIDISFDESAEGVATIRHAIANGLPFLDVETVARNQAGDVVAAMTTGIPLYDLEDQLIGYRLWSTDITESRQAVAARKEEEARLQEMARLADEQMAMQTAALSSLTGNSDTLLNAPLPDIAIIVIDGTAAGARQIAAQLTAWDFVPIVAADPREVIDLFENQESQVVVTGLTVPPETIAELKIWMGGADLPVRQIDIGRCSADQTGLSDWSPVVLFDALALSLAETATLRIRALADQLLPADVSNDRPNGETAYRDAG
ncbi:PAS domain-containing protein [Parvularcula sp. LCG005]|uniref:PAS domain-containing protein n=1 Tax=Parvularcula sp. LCG005 TaxID=3078805 RepID=UPI002942B882|nr:PAS domain-containing protein [Parvularcula sp. LCG005]WOI53771.1 PAS domain-containing protein [Parvularcula sp. LCG005]